MRFASLLTSFLVLLGCTQHAERQVSSNDTSSNTDTVSAAPDTQQQRIRIDSAMGYPYTISWVPGQRDTQDFDVLSKYRAHGKRLSSQLLVLSLDTPAVGANGPDKSRYVVVDSAIVTGLSYGDSFKNDCTKGSVGSKGLITGLASTDQGRHHPRLAWQFDTVALRIRSLPPDSVWCIQDEVD
jgi:hypothetical protein